MKYMENELKILHQELIDLIGNNSNGFIITNYRSSKQKNYFTLHLTKELIRLVETTSNKSSDDWYYRFENALLLLNNEACSNDMLLILGEKFFSVVKYIYSEKVSVFEDENNQIPKNRVPNESPSNKMNILFSPDLQKDIPSNNLSNEELKLIVGGVGAVSNALGWKLPIKKSEITKEVIKNTKDMLGLDIYISKFTASPKLKNIGNLLNNFSTTLINVFKNAHIKDSDKDHLKEETQQ
jgi:hypothetical protein